jgi:hypothetical protein
MKKMSYDELMDLDIMLRRYMHDRMQEGGKPSEVLDRFTPILDEMGEVEERAKEEEHIEL